ncbi:HK97-gp10 family putative phage morphogenesis protein [Morganella morganii]|uniref:HK97-gp10 family putative phage morphogenesis protein n=1 Tax=Morganella morganii TaxID=582 RepID=UPI00386FFFB7
MGSVIITGLSELSRKMQDLERKVSGRIARRAMNNGAGVLKKEVRQRVPVLGKSTDRRKRGTVKRNIRSKTKIQRNGQVITRIWVKSLPDKKVKAFKQTTGKKAALNPDDPFYWWFVEFGTSKMAARPFMRPGFEAKKEAAAEVVVRTLKEETEKAGNT